MQAIALNNQDSRARLRLAQVHLLEGSIGAATAEYEKAIELNPNDANILVSASYGFIYGGEFEKAVELVQKAKRINPFHPDFYYDALGWAYFFLGRYEEALTEAVQIANPSPGEHRTLAVNYARLEQLEKARNHAKKSLDLEPGFLVSTFSKTMYFKNSKHREFFLESLRMAGFPG